MKGISKDIIFKDKKSTYVSTTATIGKNVTIYEGNRIEGDSYIGDNVVLLPNNYIINSKIGANSKVICSVIENSSIGEKVSIGPYAHIRPGCVIENDAKIGNFCEIKNSKIGNRTKICHLSYVGDAEVGQNTNIGCGVIFANYNGKSKNKTKVGNNCFIGSNVNLVAPVVIDDNAYVCAGTTVVKNVKNNSFVIGRARAEEKENRASIYLKGII